MLRTSLVVSLLLAACQSDQGLGKLGDAYGAEGPMIEVDPPELNFGALASLTFLAFAYLGGISSVGGAIAAGMIGVDALVFTLLEKRTGIDSKYTVIVGAVGLIFTAIQNPEGIAGAIRSTAARLRGRTHHEIVARPTPVAAQTGAVI